MQINLHVTDVSRAKHLFHSPSEKAMKMSASLPNPWDGRL